jgi:nitrite reductase/ring-hydroxylating ferredoxin subunit
VFSLKYKWVKIADNQEELESKLAGKETSPISVNSIGCLLVKHQNEFFLVKNRCPHQGVKLDDAVCEDGFIVCSWHRYGFDLKTGRGGGLYLDNYPIEYREDGIYAGFEYFSWFGE